MWGVHGLRRSGSLLVRTPSAVGVLGLRAYSDWPCTRAAAAIAPRRTTTYTAIHAEGGILPWSAAGAQSSFLHRLSCCLAVWIGGSAGLILSVEWLSADQQFQVGALSFAARGFATAVVLGPTIQGSNATRR